MTKRRRKALGAKNLAIISSIVVLNVMGVSYASWTEEGQILTTINMGSNDPIFCDKNYRIEVVRDGGGHNPCDDSPPISDLRVDFQDDNHTLYISGELEEGYKAFIHYCVYNNGTIPVKYDRDKNDEDLKIKDGLKVSVNQQAKVIEPGEKLYSDHGNGNPKIQIQVAHKDKDKGEDKDKDKGEDKDKDKDEDKDKDKGEDKDKDKDEDKDKDKDKDKEKDKDDDDEDEDDDDDDEDEDDDEEDEDDDGDEDEPEDEEQDIRSFEIKLPFKQWTWTNY